MSLQAVRSPQPAKGARGLAHTARELVVATPALSPASLNRDAFEVFEAHPRLIGLPVVDQGRPVGLLNRNVFMHSLARPFYREAFFGKPCTTFMDRAPLVVDQDTSLQDLSFLALESGGRALTDGFIVTAGGHYVGMGTSQDMVRALSNLLADKEAATGPIVQIAPMCQAV